jgi:hypothetical protein
MGAVLLFVLIGGYVGAYYALVEPIPATKWFRLRVGTVGRPFGPRMLPWYGSAGFAVNGPFTPIHWIDRRLRPHVWEPAP